MILQWENLLKKMSTKPLNLANFASHYVIKDAASTQCILCHLFQSPPLPRALNDSGCLLGDTDLFDTGLGEEEDEEESLEAIRAAVKQKMKKRKVRENLLSLNLVLLLFCMCTGAGLLTSSTKE